MLHSAREVNDIFANKINCLFYVKWKEIFDWYCEYMQPVVLTMKQKGVQNTAEVQKLFDVCNYDCTKQPPQYKYFDFHSKQLLKCKDPKYFPQDAINKNVSDKNGEFQILFQNIYYFRQDKPINWEKMIEFNSLSIAKSMRLFGEFSFMVLYYYGQIPAYCQNIDGSKKEYLKKAHKIFDTFVCARGFFELRALYSQDLQQCLDNIYDLLKNEVGDTMHNASLWDDAVLAGHLNRVQKICDYLKSVLPPLPNTKNKS